MLRLRQFVCFAKVCGIVKSRMVYFRAICILCVKIFDVFTSGMLLSEQFVLEYAVFIFKEVYFVQSSLSKYVNKSGH